MKVEERDYFPGKRNFSGIVEVKPEIKKEEKPSTLIDPKLMFTSKNKYWEKFMLPDRSKHNNISELCHLGLVEEVVEEPAPKFRGKFK